MGEYLYRPSGVALPLIILRKLQSEAEKEQENLGEGNENEEKPITSQHSILQRERHLQQYAQWEENLRERTEAHNSFVQNQEQLSHFDEPENIGSVYVYEELLDRYHQASDLVSEIQRHLHRGEEAYFDDTNAHGNIFKGWDTFIDSKLANNSAMMGGNVLGIGGDSGVMGGNGLGNNDMQMLAMGAGGHMNHINLGINSSSSGSAIKKKMPSDDRWFSSSCSAPRMRYSQYQREDGSIGYTRRPKYSSSNNSRRSISNCNSTVRPAPIISSSSARSSSLMDKSNTTTANKNISAQKNHTSSFSVNVGHNKHSNTSISQPKNFISSTNENKSPSASTDATKTCTTREQVSQKSTTTPISTDPSSSKATTIKTVVSPSLANEKERCKISDCTASATAATNSPLKESKKNAGLCVDNDPNIKAKADTLQPQDTNTKKNFDGKKGGIESKENVKTPTENTKPMINDKNSAKTPKIATFTNTDVGTIEAPDIKLRSKTEYQSMEQSKTSQSESSSADISVTKCISKSAIESATESASDSISKVHAKATKEEATEDPKVIPARGIEQTKPLSSNKEEKPEEIQKETPQTKKSTRKRKSAAL